MHWTWIPLSVDYHGTNHGVGFCYIYLSRLFLLMDHFRFFFLAVVVSSFSVFLYISGGSLSYFHDMFHFRGLFAICLLFVIKVFAIAKKEVIFLYCFTAVFLFAVITCFVLLGRLSDQFLFLSFYDSQIPMLTC
ncbi:hypothetical protein BDV38DRAFT_252503 [Aspergillus pseudotamarii]|uniref:Uncharacterized protein n=1 Tax=Aspergillus pseudotamarii TaxID=132259 RepID=A0A5N6SQA3_ASPPS|nr:uncharacterized protein BDV38DRAFT_252503 [Aspergillus pseudotamarii]KAE8135294.1 hypothetical protein BDV38DRAFT_252503 [Aspergillus pseudotamarii]